MAVGGVILTVILIQYISEMGHVSVWVDFLFMTLCLLLPFWGEMIAANTAGTACAKTFQISVVGQIEMKFHNL